MRVPLLNLDDAAKIWLARNTKAEIDFSKIEHEYFGDDQEDLSDYELEELQDALRTVMHDHDGKNMKAYGRVIDSKVVKPVHSILSRCAEPYQLGRLEFWAWLSNYACDGFFWEFLKWRYDSNQMMNWGITSPTRIVEVYFFRAWLRGQKMYDPKGENPYKYAEKGGSDVWRSHILRVDFGKDKECVKAFLDTIYDDQGNTQIGTTELRTKLIPALRSWSSNASFSHLSYDECLSLISKLRNQEV